MIPRRAGALSLLLASAAMGQQVLYLTPQSPRVGADAPLRVGLRTAQGPAPWGPVRVLLVLGQDTRQNMDSLPAAPDGAGMVELASPPPGAAAVGLDLAPVIETIDAEALRAFCAARCDEPLPASVTGKVRVRRVQSCKTLVRVGDRPASAMAALEETAQQAEIALRLDATRAAVGSAIAFEAAIDGQEVEDARVLAMPLATGKTQEVVARERSTATIRITDPGPWRVEFHHLSKGGEGADWTLTSATLTFDVPPEPKP